MTWLAALVLGVLQGLTEFLPISSSAHLRVVSALAGWPDPGAAFTAVTQLGTETAVLLYFRRDIVAILRAWTQSLHTPALRAHPLARLGWYVILGTVPLGVLGYLFQDSIETALRDLRLIAVTLVVFGIALGLADRIAANRRPLEALTARHAALLGFAQAMALVPGVSRSGGTITAGLLLGYTRQASARYSFLLAVPAVLASGGLELTKIGQGTTPPWGQTVLAATIAFAVGYAVIAWFLRYLANHHFTPFVVYRIVAGGALMVLVSAGWLTPT